MPAREHRAADRSARFAAGIYLSHARLWRGACQEQDVLWPHADALHELWPKTPTYLSLPGCDLVAS